MARAVTFAGLSSDGNDTPSNDTPSPPGWQYWQRTPSANENSRMRWIRTSREMSLGKNCRFWPDHGAWAGCADAIAGIRAVQISASRQRTITSLLDASMTALRVVLPDGCVQRFGASRFYAGTMRTAESDLTDRLCASAPVEP